MTGTDLTILVIAVLIALVIILAGGMAYAQSKRIDAELALFMTRLENKQLSDEAAAVALHRQRLAEFAGQIADDIIQACQEGWDQELHWMLHDETWVPTQDPHQGG